MISHGTFKMAHIFKGYVCILIIYVIGSTDGISCPDLWTGFAGSCYLFGHAQTYHFVEAEAYCQQHRGHLVEIHSWTENLFVKDSVRALQEECYWLGLADEIEGFWKWYTSDTVPTFTDWFPGEPNNINGNEDCAYYYKPAGYSWNDGPCDHLCYPVCKLDPNNQIIG